MNQATSFEDYVTLIALVHLQVNLVDLTIRLFEVTLQITELALETVDIACLKVVDTVLTQHNQTFNMSGKILKMAFVPKVVSSCLNAISRSLKNMKSMFGEDKF